MNDTLTLVGLVVAALLIFLYLRRRGEARPAPPPQLAHDQRPAAAPPPSPSVDPSAALTGYRQVRITHPLVQKAARRAASSGTAAAKMVVTDGREMYFSLDAIGDDAERRRAHELLTRFQAGEEADLAEVMALLGRLGGD
ncbi:MAG: hypothetical protein KJ066_17110 [Acidobacteria bacterium]|nr:hypothetical protein [Acidobacteriota bacterium]